jgi:hypothetical protein
MYGGGRTLLKEATAGIKPRESKRKVSRQHLLFVANVHVYFL